MVDAASKNNKSILGISAQYPAEGKMNTYVLGMTYMEKAHTSTYMKNLVKNCLEKYDVPGDQVVSFTTDNASAMIAMTRQFDEDVHEDCRLDSDDSEDIDLGLPSFSTDGQLSDEQIEQIMQATIRIGEIREVMDDAEDFERLYDEFIGDISQVSSSVHTIRCAAHVIQLGVRGGIKKSSVGPLLAMSMFVVKKLRTEKYKAMSREAKVDYKIPHVSCTTRWDSDYDMVGFNLFQSFYFTKKHSQLLTYYHFFLC